MSSIVGLHNLTGEEDALARNLAEALGISPYDARLRLRAAAGGPAVAAVFSGPEEARACSQALEARGFQTVLLTPESIETDAGRFLVRSFTLGDESLEIVSRHGETLAVPYGKVELILRGTAIASQTESETVREKKFSLGRAVASGGLVMTKSTKKTHETTSESREGLLHLYAANLPPIVFWESAVQYDSLGAAMKPSRQMNFNFLIQELKKRCPAAVFDDRLMNRLWQSRVLGPSLVPAAHLDIALSLMSAALRPAR